MSDQYPKSTEPADSNVSFEDGKQYWEGISADVNGMLGGFPFVSKVDLQGSRNFLAKLGIGVKDGQRRLNSVLEGGAGIGRITQGLLVDIAEHVDVVEPVAKFTADLQGQKGVRDVFNVGLQDWQPVRKDTHYDVVWNQWCLGHLTDSQLVRYLQRCQAVLTPDGLVIVKENLSTSSEDLFDDMDSSVTRQEKKFLSIFEQAGLRVVKTELQRGFPEGLYPVKIFALKPRLPCHDAAVSLHSLGYLGP